MPVYIATSIIVEFRFSDINGSPSATAWTNIHNLMNPQMGFWEMLVPAISSLCEDSVEPISFESWFEALEAIASRINDGPAIKLGKFFE